MNTVNKLTANLAIVLLALLGPAGTAWADQQDDLEVTMKVVPSNASGSSAIVEIKLPDAASDRANEASSFGLSTANRAREMKGDLGRDFGQSVSEAARAKGHVPNPPGKSKAP
ncbi:MAG TPA: hypothetical protein VJO54_17010 [Burkholderiales bacterium]|nr:hypothetical protein [Burkholderiales bacterium]